MRSHKPFRSKENAVNDLGLPKIQTFRYRPLLSAVLLIALATLILAARRGSAERMGGAAAVNAGPPAIAVSVTP